MTAMIAFLLLVVSFMLPFVILSFLMLVFDLFLDLPYVATDRKKIATIIKFAQIKKNQIVVDLGSGDGRLLLAAAKAGAKAIGYELNPFLILLTEIKASRFFHSRSEARESPRSHSGSVTIIRQNLWKADLKIADVIFVYSLKRDVGKFEDFIWQNAEKGTRVIVNTNPFPDKKTQKQENGIFLYIV